MISMRLVDLKYDLLEVISHIIKVDKNKIKEDEEEIRSAKDYISDIRNNVISIATPEFKESTINLLKYIGNKEYYKFTIEAVSGEYFKKYLEVIEKEEKLNNEYYISIMGFIIQICELNDRISKMEIDFLEKLEVEIKEKFNDARDVDGIYLYLKELENSLDDKVCVYCDYAARVLKMIISKELYMLENYDKKYSDEELIDYFQKSHGICITNEYYDMYLRAYGEEGYNEINAEEEIMFDNLALHPMFLKFLLADDKGLFGNIELDEKYIYSIAKFPEESDESCDVYRVFGYDKDLYSKIPLNDDNVDENKEYEVEAIEICIIKEYDGKIIVE